MKNFKKVTVICDEMSNSINSFHDDSHAANEFMNAKPSEFETAFWMSVETIYVPLTMPLKEIVGMDFNLFLREKDKFSFSNWSGETVVLWFVQQNLEMRKVEYITKKEISIPGYSVMEFNECKAYYAKSAIERIVDRSIESGFYAEVDGVLRALVLSTLDGDQAAKAIEGTTKGKVNNLVTASIIGSDNHCYKYVVNNDGFILNFKPKDEAIVDVTCTKKMLTKAVELLKLFIDCPKSADDASRAISFDVNNPTHRDQLVVNFSCSYEKVFLAEKFLGEINGSSNH